ncbi:MAG: hypothetical protein ABW133_13670, partial [Polyangiaceae bacterium]
EGAAPVAPEAVPTTAAPPGVAHPSPAATSAGPPPPPRPLALRLTLLPEWGFRAFRDKEPVGEDKSYTASGVPIVGGRAELYPIALAADVPEELKNIGITVNYARALGIKSRDIDTDIEVDAQWYQFGFGFRYRMLGGDNPLAIGITAGVQRSVFDFETTPAGRPVALGRYTILPLGFDIRRSWDRFSLFGDARFLLPITVSPPGDRTPGGGRYGFSVALATAFSITRMFEIEARATYSMVSYQLPSGIATSSRSSSIYDEALTFGLGGSFLF